MTFDATNHRIFFDDLAENRFHIFSREHAKNEGFYPTEFTSYPELSFSDIVEGDTITLRAFFPTSKTVMSRIDSGYIDLEVEDVDHNSETLFGNILTELPATFALSKGTSIEVTLDEVWFRQDR